jgi:hypothetical protein
MNLSTRKSRDKIEMETLPPQVGNGETKEASFLEKISYKSLHVNSDIGMPVC